MLTTGDGIALATVVLTTGGVIIVALIKKRTNGVSKDLCQSYRNGVQTKIDAIHEKLETESRKSDERDRKINEIHTILMRNKQGG